ncbi:HAMP domain-containing histidine kinase [Oribacterium sp. oral taxon 102]|uniref:sensor histidine kinase n=1 Tax=Oribacterium sp. oral taxon 102 TaxID=671214 RepID=UPI0015BFC691|nr:HAMP domain-containing sensor histidine kinase [Oribacterium sp. oral taxon 102]NWO20482.1 HAMP domain-containing histidine kinase [Oribacterium sp. oral taxon 102]
MIRKLQKRLLLASMLSLFLVLCILIGTASAMNYHKLIRNADDTLQILRENGGRFPSPPESPPGTDSASEQHLFRERPFESRYFLVVFRSDGTAESVELGRIAAVDRDSAVRYGQRILVSRGSEGFLDDYRYLKYEEDGRTGILFLDCVRSLEDFRHFLCNILLVCFAGMIAVWAVLQLLSRRIVKPFLESDRKQKQFVTDAGHELKTPLAALRADADLLEMDFGENEWLQDIGEQIRRLTALTHHLISLSRLEEQPREGLRSLCLSEIAVETAECFRAPARVQRKTLTASIQRELYMQGDPAAMRELFSILLDNAVKYSPEGSEISLSLTRRRNTLLLTVYNRCKHLSRESVGHLFDRFYRADASRSSQTGGFGLGLSIAAAAVRAHRGEIMAETADEESLLITVKLPSERAKK